MNKMAKMSRSNCKARQWLNEHGYTEIHIFPHTRWSKDVNFKGLKFDGIALSYERLCLFQVKSNGKPSKAYIGLMQGFARHYWVDVIWFNVRDRKEIEVFKK